VTPTDPDAGSEPIAKWLLNAGRRIGTPGELLTALCERLVGRGLPLDRASLHISTLHPQVRGIRYLWQSGSGQQAEVRYGRLDTTVDAAYRLSPLYVVHQTGRSVRRRLDDGTAPPSDFPIVAELRADGITDYLAVPLLFSSGPPQVATWSSRRPGGFAEADIAQIESLLPELAATIESHEQRRMLQTLLETYLGRQAGQRVLNGTIQRGDGQTIAAALWYCDLREFTTMSDAIPRDEIIALLNDYFECMAGPVQENGGEVLKFIGDALLAIFPIVDDLDRDRACRIALAAAEAALVDLQRLNDRRRREERPALEVGIGLHTGAVMYGNIGAPDRLDFTVIGPAVNLVTRIEELCPMLGEAVLTSSRFASPCGSKLVSRGRHQLKGIAVPQEIFALP
jgi:adenylate cyclase